MKSSGRVKLRLILNVHEIAMSKPLNSDLF